MTLFYDTCSLLASQGEAFNSYEKFYICNITLNELENIKTSSIKDEETKYKARTLLRLLEKNEDKYDIIVYTPEASIRTAKFNLPISADSKIISTVYCFFEDNNIADGCFITQDLACKAIAKSIGLNVKYLKDKDESEYTGFVDYTCSDSFLNTFYSEFLQDNKNFLRLLDNQYLVLRDANNKVIDKYKWYNGGYHQVQFQKFESKMFGKIVPKNGDVYQQLAMDSMASNQITVMRGSAGTGKSLLGLAYLFQELEKGHIDKIIMFVNPVATKDSCRFGFLPGTATEKILGSQIGNFLGSKLGDISMVERLVYDGILQLVPIADCRGFDTTGINAGLYVTEGQNTTIEMMKLILQRIGEDTICIIEGDDRTQVDLSTYGGNNNGLKRLSEVFRGQDYYGEIILQNCYRSKIADRAELM